MCSSDLYLLNPLKSSYTYDDMAKEYLNGRILPAREELLGKKTVDKAWEESAEGLTAVSYTHLKPMVFYPNTYYKFNVTGAGTQNTNPAEGDVRWTPLYWSLSLKPQESDIHRK